MKRVDSASYWQRVEQKYGFAEQLEVSTILQAWNERGWDLFWSSQEDTSGMSICMLCPLFISLLICETSKCRYIPKRWTHDCQLITSLASQKGQTFMCECQSESFKIHIFQGTYLICRIASIFILQLVDSSLNSQGRIVYVIPQEKRPRTTHFFGKEWN